MVRRRKKRLSDALSVLNEAAQDKKEELQEVLSERYDELRDTLSALEGRASRVGRRVSETAGETGERLMNGARRTAESVDEKVHTNPWSWIAGAALGSLLLGYIFGRRAEE